MNYETVPRDLKVRKFQLDTLSCFRMVEEKQEGAGAYFAPSQVR